MRMIYTSPRIENADRVARIFLDNDIAARVLNDGGWRGRSHRRFSYRDGGRRRGAWPQVWVVNADDQPRARQLLREIGIEPASRFDDAATDSRLGIAPIEHKGKHKTATRVRRILLAVLVALLALTLLRMLT